jgi:hypothetical protein
MDETRQIIFSLPLMASHSRTILPGLIISRLVYWGLNEESTRSAKLIFRNAYLSVLTVARKPLSARPFTLQSFQDLLGSIRLLVWSEGPFKTERSTEIHIAFHKIWKDFTFHTGPILKSPNLWWVKSTLSTLLWRIKVQLQVGHHCARWSGFQEEGY